VVDPYSVLCEIISEVMYFETEPLILSIFMSDKTSILFGTSGHTNDLSVAK
jgi:hypothetical protein